MLCHSQSSTTTLRNDDILCQLFSQEQPSYPELWSMGLPIQLPAAPASNDNIPKIIDCTSGKRYSLMQLNSQSGNYEFDHGQELRVRIRNTSSFKTSHFVLLFQDAHSRYHVLFPQFVPCIRSIPNCFKTLAPGQESVIAIPTDKLPILTMTTTAPTSTAATLPPSTTAKKLFASTPLTNSKALSVRLVLMVTAQPSFQDFVMALQERQQLEQQVQINASDFCVTNEPRCNKKTMKKQSKCEHDERNMHAKRHDDVHKLLVFNYKFNVKSVGQHGDK